MSHRDEEDIKLLQKYLNCDVKYRFYDVGVEFYIDATIAGQPLPTYRVAYNGTDSSEERLTVLSDMTIGHLTTALINAIKNHEQSELRDAINKGLRYASMVNQPEGEERIVNEFENLDFRNELNLIDTKFKDIEVVPDMEHTALQLYYRDGDRNRLAANVDKDSNVVKIISDFKEKFDYEPSDVFTRALRNQIREFKELFSEELVEKKNKERQTEIDKQKEGFTNANK